MYLYKIIIDEDIAINDIEHAMQFVIFIGGIDKPDWVKMVNAAVFLDYETSFNQLADRLIELRRIVDLL